MNDDLAVALLASRVRKVQSRYYDLLKEVSSPGELIEKHQVTRDIPDLQSSLKSALILERTRDELKRWHNQGIQALAFGTPQYPKPLNSIFNPPPILFFRGVLPDRWPTDHCLAVVGSRSASSNSQRIARVLSKDLAARGLCIVSGLALGVDTVAHYAALDGGGTITPTIAVLGGGLDNIYPASNSSLSRDILAKGGLLISQFEPGAKTFPSNFLARNRIIAGLSCAVLVIQAAAQSGSLATARFAMEEGREVLVVPGAALDDSYEGSHRLIREGATLVSKLEHVLELFQESSSQSKKGHLVQYDLSKAEGQILRLIAEREAVQYEELLGIANIDVDFVVMELELKGLLDRHPGNFLKITYAGSEAISTHLPRMTQ